MKQDILQRVRHGKSREEKINLLREELHHLILQEMDRRQGFRDLCFVGGTALRIVFGLDRYSEDLDFSTSEKCVLNYDLALLVSSVQRALVDYGCDVQIKKMRNHSVVQSCFLVFTNLLSDLDKVFSKTQTLAIKLEVDTNPPHGAQESLSPIVGARLYKLRHYTLPSLFAGKIHAVLFRKYTKGRDLYDFLWYVGKGVPVNRVLLENAARQSQKRDFAFDESALRETLKKRFEKIDFKQAKNDVLPFLQDRNALDLFERDIFVGSTAKIAIL